MVVESVGLMIGAVVLTTGATYGVVVGTTAGAALVVTTYVVGLAYVDVHVVSLPLCSLLVYVVQEDAHEDEKEAIGYGVKELAQDADRAVGLKLHASVTLE